MTYLSFTFLHMLRFTYFRVINYSQENIYISNNLMASLTERKRDPNGP